MDITFERGDRQRPKGHALAYFRVDTEPDQVYATYVVILPVQADLTKYVPPFLASHLGNLPLSDFSAFAMPPVPEPVDSFPELERLSQLRDDDLIYAGSTFSFDLPRMMESVTELVQAYAQLCTHFFASASPARPSPTIWPSGEGRSCTASAAITSSRLPPNTMRCSTLASGWNAPAAVSLTCRWTATDG